MSLSPGDGDGELTSNLGIGMARILYDGLVEYEDKTPATTTQMAKDVTEFLNWAAEPEMDERKKMGMKVLMITSVLLALSIWVKKYKWAPVKTRKLVSPHTYYRILFWFITPSSDIFDRSTIHHHSK